MKKIGSVLFGMSIAAGALALAGCSSVTSVDTFKYGFLEVTPNKAAGAEQPRPVDLQLRAKEWKHEWRCGMFDRCETDFLGSLYVFDARTGKQVRWNRVEVFLKDDTGQRISLETAGRGDVFGEISLLDGGPRTASVVVTEDLEALTLTRSHLDLFLTRRPSAALDMLSAERFDEPGYDRQISKIEELRAELFKRMGVKIKQTVKGLSPEERRMFADVLRRPSPPPQ